MWYIAQSVMAVDDRGCRIQWDAPSTEDVDGYHVYMREGENGPFLRMTGDRLRKTEWESPPLRRDVRYYLYITSIDKSDNESSGSPIETFELGDAIVDLSVHLSKSPQTMNIKRTSTSFPVETPSEFMTQFTLGGKK